MESAFITERRRLRTHNAWNVHVNIWACVWAAHIIDGETNYSGFSHVDYRFVRIEYAYEIVVARLHIRIHVSALNGGHIFWDWFGYI